jgi:tetraacyldisaccharide 4'-kinase
VVLTRSELVGEETIEGLKRQISVLTSAPVLTSRFSLKLRGWSGASAQVNLSGKSVIALSAIGNPAAFERGLANLGAKVLPRRFPDHRPYTDVDIEALERAAKEAGAAVVTTEKDEVKLRATRWSRSRPADVWIAEIALEFTSTDTRTWTRLLSNLFQKS